MEKLTDKQASVLGAIKHFREVNENSPTRKEIAEIMGFKSDNAASEHLKALERKGAIELTPMLSRGIRVL